MSDADDILQHIQGGPAYDTSAWETGKSEGPQCSLSGEFCFFCQFREEHKEPEFGEDDDCTSLKNLVTTLARQHKELPLIVLTVYNMYEKHIRPNIEYRHSITGILLKQPKWTKTSIQRHLTYSLEFPELFDGVVSQVFQSIISRQQEQVMDNGNKSVIEDRRRSLMDTINTYTKWRLTQSKLYHGKPMKSKKAPS